jgi:alpha-glucuronidase
VITKFDVYIYIPDFGLFTVRAQVSHRFQFLYQLFLLNLSPRNFLKENKKRLVVATALAAGIEAIAAPYIPDFGLFTVRAQVSHRFQFLYQQKVS